MGEKSSNNSLKPFSKNHLYESRCTLVSDGMAIARLGKWVKVLWRINNLKSQMPKSKFQTRRFDGASSWSIKNHQNDRVWFLKFGYYLEPAKLTGAWRWILVLFIADWANKKVSRAT